MIRMVIILALVSCSGPNTTNEKKAAAEGTYGGQLQECVAKNATRAGADLCAEKVRARWDAGVEGGVK